MIHFGNKIYFGALVVFLSLGAGAVVFFSGLFSDHSQPVLENVIPSEPVWDQKISTTTAEANIPEVLPGDLPATTTVTENQTPENPIAILPEPVPSDGEPDAATTTMETERFVVSLDANTIEKVASDLFDQGFVKDKLSASRAFGATAVDPGGYRISKEMSLSRIVEVLGQKPYMKWVVVPEGLRKEEIAPLLGNALGWTKEQEGKWTTVYTNMKFDNIEGVYFPDTYLIPVDEAPLDVANRLVTKFNEKFAPYLPEFSSQNIKWTTGLKLASIVQREAASDGEMPLIAGILWNRLDQDMALGVDAALQYARGDAGNGWWAPITVADKLLDSPYNTYKNKGLPPHPICNPGIPAIEAALKPAKTDCLYYLHGSDSVIHCAKTYEEHQKNIEQYLRPVS